MPAVTVVAALIRNVRVTVPPATRSKLPPRAKATVPDVPEGVTFEGLLGVPVAVVVPTRLNPEGKTT